MTSSAESFAADSSVALAALDRDNVRHDSAVRAVQLQHPALAGHAVFETFSVLTRRPAAARVSPATAARLIAHSFPERCWLGVRGAERLMARLAELGIAGGAVYDALIAQAALDNGRLLLSLDRRAETTYRAIGVSFRILA